MKIELPERAYIEIVKSPNPGKVIISIGVRDKNNPLSLMVSSAELTEEQFMELVSI